MRPFGPETPNSRLFIEKDQQKKPEIWNIVTPLISPSKRILISGPGQYFSDPTLFWYAAVHKGPLIILDPKHRYGNLGIPQEGSETIGTIKGMGNITEYIRVLDALRISGGMELAIPYWLGPNATLEHITLPDTVDLIADHCTTAFVGRIKQRDNEGPLEDFIRKVGKEYLRVLADNGLLLLQTYYHDTACIAETVLSDVGFTVTLQEAEDILEIPLDRITYMQLVNWIDTLGTMHYEHESEEIFDIRLKKHMENALFRDGDAYGLRFTFFAYAGNFLLIAKKQAKQIRRAS